LSSSEPSHSQSPPTTAARLSALLIEVKKARSNEEHLLDNVLAVLGEMKDAMASVDALKQRNEALEKEVRQLKGNMLDNCTAEDLQELESTIKEARRKVKSAREALQSKNDKLCVVCYDKQKDTVFFPCGHLVCCQRCSIKLPTCPICRQAIVRSLLVHQC